MKIRMALYGWVLFAWLLCVLCPQKASAEVLREGDWSAQERVSLTAEGVSRAEAVRRLAEAAGWSVVVSDLGPGEVHVRVQDQPAAAVLDLLLADGDFVARRSGTLISIAVAASPEAAPATVTAEVPPVVAGQEPPREVEPDTRDQGHRASRDGDHPDAADKRGKKTHKKGQDRVITSKATIGPDEVVQDLIVFGGDVLVKGTVTGDLASFGGKVTLADGAFVGGDLVGFGAALAIENGAEVGGEVGVLGGSLEQGDEVEIDCSTCDMSFDHEKKDENPTKKFFADFFGRLTGVSLLWVLGAALLSLASARVERVRQEIVARPWKSLGYGALTLLGLLMLFVTLMVTLIGIPLAVLGAILAGLSAYMGFCVVLFAGGQLMFGGRTQNPYLLLAGGCVVYFLVGSIPVLGGLVGFGLTLMGLGALFTTRAAGLLEKKPPSEPPPAPMEPPTIEPSPAGSGS